MVDARTIDPDIDHTGATGAGVDLQAWFNDNTASGTGGSGTRALRKRIRPPVVNAHYNLKDLSAQAVGGLHGLRWVDKNFWLLEPYRDPTTQAWGTLTLDRTLPFGHRRVTDVRWTAGTRTLTIDPAALNANNEFKTTDVGKSCVAANLIGLTYGADIATYISPGEVRLVPHQGGGNLTTSESGRTLHIAHNNADRVVWPILNWVGGSYLQVRRTKMLGLLPPGAAGSFLGQSWEEDIAVSIGGVTGLAEVAFCTGESLGSDFIYGRRDSGVNAQGLWIHHNAHGATAVQKAGRQFLALDYCDDVLVEWNTGANSPRAFLDLEHGPVRRVAVRNNDVTRHGLFFIANGNDNDVLDLEVAYNRDFETGGGGSPLEMEFLRVQLPPSSAKNRRRLWIHHNENMVAGPINEQIVVRHAQHILIEDNTMPSTSRWSVARDSSVHIDCCLNVMSRNNDLGNYPDQLWEVRRNEGGCNLNAAANTAFKSNHGYAVNDRIRFDHDLSGTGLNRMISYHVVSVPNANEFQVSAISGGAPFNILVDKTGATASCGKIVCTPLSDQTFVPFGINAPVIDTVYADDTAAPVAPPVPTGFTATRGNVQNVLTWNAVTGIPDLAGYRVYRSLDGDTFPMPGNPTYTITAGTQTKIDTGLTNGTEYFYVITAYSTAGLESSRSSVTSAIPRNPASVPTAPVVTDHFADATTITLEWAPPPAIDEVVTWYIERSPTGAGTWTVVQSALDVAELLWTDTTVVQDVAYDYRMRARDMENDYGPYSTIFTETALRPSGPAVGLFVLGRSRIGGPDRIGGPRLSSLTIVADLGLAGETDTVPALAVTKIAPIGVVGETDQGWNLVPVGQSPPLDFANEHVLVPPLTVVKVVTLGRADETDVAFDFVSGGVASMSAAADTETSPRLYAFTRESYLADSIELLI